MEEALVVRKFRTTTQHGAIAGKTQESEVNGYNLDVIISVGYRVKSPQGTQFRIWATQRLKEYIIKGFALNDDRFKSGEVFEKYIIAQKAIEKEASLKEIEEDMLRLKKLTRDQNQSNMLPIQTQAQTETYYQIKSINDDKQNEASADGRTN